LLGATCDITIFNFPTKTSFLLVQAPSGTLTLSARLNTTLEKWHVAVNRAAAEFAQRLRTSQVYTDSSAHSAASPREYRSAGGTVWKDVHTRAKRAPASPDGDGDGNGDGDGDGDGDDNGKQHFVSLSPSARCDAVSPTQLRVVVDGGHAPYNLTNDDVVASPDRLAAIPNDAIWSYNGDVVIPFSIAYMCELQRASPADTPRITQAEYTKHCYTQHGINLRTRAMEVSLRALLLRTVVV
jgi:hypothetical protein